MANFLVGLVIVFGGWWLLKSFANAQPAQLRGLTRKVAGGALIAVSGFLALRGAMNVAMPLFVLGLGLFGQQMVFPNGLPWTRKSPGQRSKVSTSMLAMELDHDSGTMDGEALVGPSKGKRLSAMSDNELQAFHGLCGTSRDQSRALLEAWLDRNKGEWRAGWGVGGASATSASGPMSKDEARAILGVKADATEDDVRAAHRRLMKEFHPDKGGSDYLAAKINAAKDVLIS